MRINRASSIIILLDTIHTLQFFFHADRQQGQDAAMCHLCNAWQRYFLTDIVPKQILASTRHPDDAWKKLAELQEAAREAIAAVAKDAKSSRGAENGPSEHGIGARFATCSDMSQTFNLIEYCSIHSTLKLLWLLHVQKQCVYTLGPCRWSRTASWR